MKDKERGFVYLLAISGWLLLFPASFPVFQLSSAIYIPKSASESPDTVRSLQTPPFPETIEGNCYRM